MVEVLSPSTNRNDRISKKYAYEKAGVREYWIISPNDKSVEVYLLQGDLLILSNVYTLENEDEIWRKIYQYLFMMIFMLKFKKFLIELNFSID